MLTLTPAQNEFFKKYLIADIYEQLKIEVSTTEKINNEELKFLYSVLALGKAEKTDQPAILGSPIEKLMSIYSTQFMHFFSSLYQKGIITLRENFLFLADDHINRSILNFEFTDISTEPAALYSDDVNMDNELCNTVNISYVQGKILEYASALEQIIGFIKKIYALDDFDSLINFAKKYNPEGNDLIREMEASKKSLKSIGPDERGIEHIVHSLNLHNCFDNQQLKFPYAKLILHSLIIHVLTGCEDLARFNWSTERGLVKTNDLYSILGSRSLLNVIIGSLRDYANRMYDKIDTKSAAEIRKLAPRFETSFKNLLQINGKISSFRLVTDTPESRTTISPFELFYRPHSHQEVVSDRQITPMHQYK